MAYFLHTGGMAIRSLGVPPGIAWWDASDLSTITASGINTLAIADKIDAHDLTAGTTKPETGTFDFNGLNLITPVQVTSGGLGDTPGFMAMQPGLTVFAVCAAVAITGGSSERAIVQEAPELLTPSNAQPRLLLGATGASGGLKNALAHCRDNAPTTRYNVIETANPLGLFGFDFHLLRLTDSLTEATLSVDGDTAVSSGAYTRGTFTGTNRKTSILARLSAGNDLDQWGGPFAEIRIWDSVLSPTDIATVEAELFAKWGLPGVWPQALTSVIEVGRFSLGTNNAQPTLPGAAVGDLVLYFIAQRGTTPFTVSTGWVILAPGTAPSNLHGGIAARILTGGADDTLSISGGADDYTSIGLRIQRHSVSSVSTDIQVAGPTTASTGQANPPSLNTGIDRDWLVIPFGMADCSGSDIMNVPPVNYTSLLQARSATGLAPARVMSAIAGRCFGGQTFDPGIFSHQTQENGAWTLAVPGL